MMSLFNKKEAAQVKEPLFKDSLLPPEKLPKKEPFFVRNPKPFVENNDPSVSNITLEKIWNLKNIQIALFVGFILLLVDVIALFLTNASFQTSLIIILISVIIYAIVLYFLLNPPSQKTINRERIKQIEKPTIKIIERSVEKPVIRVVEKPIEKVKFIERPIIQKVSSPVPLQSEDLMKKYPFVASTRSKKIHSTLTTAGRMIKPENREFADKVEHLLKKGYSRGQITPKQLAKK